MIEPGSPEWKSRVAAMAAAEMQAPETLFYLSFAGDEGFRGAVVTRANGPTTALIKVHRLGINPGGQALTIELPADHHHRVPEDALDRLLNLSDVNAILGPSKTIRELAAEEAVSGS